VLACLNFTKELLRQFPERKIVLSTTTKTGNTVAGKVIPRDIEKFYFPLDFTFSVRRVLDIIKPSLFIAVETEIWPNLIVELSERRVPIALVNGRLSERSFKGYRRIRFFIGGILKRINLFCMRAAGDAERIKRLGAPADRVKITGNMKFDLELSPNRPAKEAHAGIPQGEKIIIAGSTHGGEDEIILQAYKNAASKFKNLRLLIAPRHIDNCGAIKKLAKNMGFEPEMVSEIRKTPAKKPGKNTVLILDTLGELGGLYSVATIVFMGGSLVKRGGHNLIEPAMFGKPIIFGPYMFNFKAMAKLFIENDAAVQLKGAEELSSRLLDLLGDEEKRKALGEKARQVINKERGAVARNI